MVTLEHWRKEVLKLTRRQLAEQNKVSYNQVKGCICQVEHGQLIGKKFPFQKWVDFYRVTIPINQIDWFPKQTHSLPELKADLVISVKQATDIDAVSNSEKLSDESPTLDTASNNHEVQ